MFEYNFNNINFIYLAENRTTKRFGKRTKTETNTNKMSKLVRPPKKSHQQPPNSEDEWSDDPPKKTLTLKPKPVDPKINIKVYCLIRDENPKKDTDYVTVMVYEQQDRYSFTKTDTFWAKAVSTAKKAILQTQPYSWAHRAKGIQLAGPQGSYQAFGSLNNLRWESVNIDDPAASRHRMPLPELSPSGFYKVRISFRARYGKDMIDDSKESEWMDDWSDDMQNLSPSQLRKISKQAREIHNARNILNFNALDTTAGLSNKIFQAAQLHTEALIYFSCVKEDDNKLRKRSELESSIFQTIIKLMSDKRIESLEKPENPDIRNNIEATVMMPIINRIKNKTLTQTLWKAAHHYAVSLKTVPQEINILEEAGRRTYSNLKTISDNNFRRLLTGRSPLTPPHLINTDHDPIAVSETRHEHIMHSQLLTEFGDRDLSDNDIQEILNITGDATPTNDCLIIGMDNDEIIDEKTEAEEASQTEAETESKDESEPARSTSGVSSARSKSRSHSPTDRDWKRNRPKSESDNKQPLNRENHRDSEQKRSPERRSRETSAPKDRRNHTEQFSSPNKRHSERRSHSDDKRRRPSYDVEERRNRLEHFNPTEKRNYNTDNILGNIKDEDIRNLEPFRPKRYNSKGFKATIGDDGRIYMLPNRSNRS